MATTSEMRMTSAWITELTQNHIMGRRVKRGHYFRRSTSRVGEACALINGVVKEVLGPAWLSTGSNIATDVGLNFFRINYPEQTDHVMASLDLICGDPSRPTHIVKIKATRQREKVREGMHWLEVHREIARREWPEIQAFMLLVDTGSERRFRNDCPDAINRDFSFNPDGLKGHFERDEIPKVTLPVRDVVSFGRLHGLVGADKLALLNDIGC